MYIGDEPKKETFKCAMADFVINELVIEQVKTNTEQSKRIYAYYKMLMDYYKNCPPDKQGPVVEKENTSNRKIQPEDDNSIFEFFKEDEPDEE